MNKLHLTYICLASPVLLFLILWLVVYQTLPETTIVSKPIFYFQYAMTLLTISLIPSLLWFVRRERFSTYGQYDLFFWLRLMVLVIMTFVDIVAYFAIPNVAFFYLAVITYLSLFFAIK